MSCEQTQEGGARVTDLQAVRGRMNARPDAPLRPEELAMLRDWYQSCEDPENRRELGRIIGLSE